MRFGFGRNNEAVTIDADDFSNLFICVICDICG